MAYMSHHFPANCSDSLETSLRYAVGSTRAYASPIVVAMGVLGNALIVVIFVLEARLARWNRFGVWCVSLAVSDTSVLILGGLFDDFLGRGLAHVYGREVMKLDAYNRPSCKILEYLQHSALFSSSYLLVIFSADRLLTVCQPLRLMTQRYVRHAVATATGVALLGMTFMAPVAAVYDLERAGFEDMMTQSCRVAINCTEAYQQPRTTAAYVLYFKAFGVFVAPCLLQAGLSMAIVGKLVQVQRMRRELMPTDRDLEMSRYYANLAVSVAFCVLVAPLCVVMVLRTGCGLCSPRPSCRCHVLEQLAKLLDTTKDVSYAVNFWVYLAFVRSFRHRVALALAYGFVKLRLVRLCPRWGPSLAAVDMVDRLEMKRNPGAACHTQTAAAAAVAAAAATAATAAAAAAAATAETSVAGTSCLPDGASNAPSGGEKRLRAD